MSSSKSWERIGDFFQSPPQKNIGKPNNLKVFGVRKPKCLNSIASIVQGHLEGD
jgi:hypothetical protein